MRKDLSPEQASVLAKYTELHIQRAQLELNYAINEQKLSQSQRAAYFSSYEIILKAMDALTDIMEGWNK